MPARWRLFAARRCFCGQKPTAAMKYNTIIFDFDGTLADTQEGLTKGFQKGLAAFGVQESLENIKALIGPPLTATIKTKYGFSDADAAVAMKICEDYQLGEGVAEVRFFEGIPQLLDGLKALGLHIALATNCPATTAHGQMEYLGLGKWLDVVETNNDAQTRGSKADFIRWAMQRCGSTPERCLMVGDRKNDLEGGKQNGTDTAGVLYGYGSRQELAACAPTFLCATPAELLEAIQNA